MPFDILPALVGEGLVVRDGVGGVGRVASRAEHPHSRHRGAQWTLAIVLVGFCVVYPTVGALTWRGFVRDAKANKPGVRRRAYVEVLLVQWPVAAVLLGAWCWDECTIGALGLGRPGLAGWIALATIAGFAVLVALCVATRRLPSLTVACGRGELRRHGDGRSAYQSESWRGNTNAQPLARSKIRRR